jgi:hypothetical protein
VGQLTDASVVLRLGYQAIRRSGLPTEEILTKAGVALNQMETNERTPLSAQYAFWVAAEEVSRDPDIGLHLGENLPLYRGQVIEHLFISSENFGEGLKRALAYQRLISDAFHAKLVVEDDRCYLTNGEQPWAENLVNRHFSECAMSGILRFFKFITEARFKPSPKFSDEINKCSITWPRYKGRFSPKCRPMSGSRLTSSAATQKAYCALKGVRSLVSI